VALKSAPVGRLSQLIFQRIEISFYRGLINGGKSSIEACCVVGLMQPSLCFRDLIVLVSVAH